MSDFSADFDPRSVGWWQRRSVIRRLKRTPWLTGADRDLRVQRARAAHTRGELNALTRDLAVGGPTPQPAWTPSQPQTYGQVPVAPAPPPRAVTAPRKRNLRTSVLIGGIFLLVTCGGGFVSCVSAIVDTVSESTSQAGAPDDLLTVGGWSRMIEDLDEGIDISATVEAVVRPDAATIAIPDDVDTVLSYYYDGDINLNENETRNQARTEFDLTLVEGDLVQSAIDLARDGAMVDEGVEAWVLVSATTPLGPTVTVTFPDESDGYALVMGLDGEIVSETQVS